MPVVTPTELRHVLARFPSIPLSPAPSIVEPMPRLSSLVGGGPLLLVKRDDALSFGFGGNKVRKLSLVAARAQADGADTLITAGAVQSNHARVTAAAAAKLGMRAVLVVNGRRPARATGNMLLDEMLGAEVVFVESRDDRAPMMHEIAERLGREGRRPFEIPIGASTPLGALAFVVAIAELADQVAPPAAIIHATSSCGTQAGLIAGCRLLGWPTRVIGISADDSSAAIEARLRTLVGGIADLIELDPATLLRDLPLEVDDRFVGSGYGVPTEASTEAIELVARTEALFLDPTYTAKAMAALIAYLREQRFTKGQTVLFWHTGGQAGLFA
jgi:1-aminocyclopropane-1-carboxylate deaminase/D-cysteine desulfhydrase-like pyridoxal-dependent ACC family enzyme